MKIENWLSMFPCHGLDCFIGFVVSQQIDYQSLIRKHMKKNKQWINFLENKLHA